MACRKIECSEVRSGMEGPHEEVIAVAYGSQCEIAWRNLTEIFQKAASGVTIEFMAEPGPGVGPIPVRGAGLEAEVGGRLLQRLTEEEPEVDQPGDPGLFLGEPGQGLIEREQIDTCRIR